MSGERLLLVLTPTGAARLGAAKKSEKWLEARGPSFVVVSNAASARIGA